MAVPSSILYHGVCPGEGLSGTQRFPDNEQNLGSDVLNVTSMTFSATRTKKEFTDALTLSTIGVRYSNPKLTIEVEGEVISVAGIIDQQPGTAATTLTNFANGGLNDQIFAGGDTGGFEAAAATSATVMEENSRSGNQEQVTASMTFVNYPLVVT